VWDANSLSKNLQKLSGVRVERNVRLATLTSFRVGGPADVFAVAENRAGLVGLLGLVGEAGARHFVLGAGTNVVFDDAGFRGVVLQLGRGFAGMSSEENVVIAGAAARWSDLVSYCVARSLAGLHRMAGIPGSVGGALAGNAGAFGATVGDAVREVRGLGAGGEEKTVSSSGIRFGYRCAEFGDELVLTGAALSLEPGERRAMEAEVEEILSKRKEKQPLELPSAGSVFRNPPGMSAGRLIEESGLKGKSIGGAQVSEKHANFIVNRKGATSKDIVSLIELVRDSVWKKFSVGLELEIKLIT